MSTIIKNIINTAVHLVKKMSAVVCARMRAYTRAFVLSFVVMSIIVVQIGFVPARADAVFNKEINYQGKLTNASNVTVADGVYHMSFKLYTVATGGAAIWTEDRSTAAGDRVTVTNGLFSVLLGSSTPLTSVDFNQTLYLGVEIGGSSGSPSWDGEMTPRKKLGAVPAAFVSSISDTVDGISSEQFLRNDASNATSTATSWLSFVQNGAGKIAEFFGPSSASVLSILSGGNVGIGTTSPYAKLSVVGPVVAEYFNATSSNATSTFAGDLIARRLLASSDGVVTNTAIGWSTDPDNGLIRNTTNAWGGVSAGVSRFNITAGGDVNFGQFDSAPASQFQILTNTAPSSSVIDLLRLSLDTSIGIGTSNGVGIGTVYELQDAGQVPWIGARQDVIATDTVSVGGNRVSADFVWRLMGSGTVRESMRLTSLGELKASYFTSTSTTASTFPYASTTALTVSGTGYFGTASTTNLIVTGNGTSTFNGNVAIGPNTYASNNSMAGGYGAGTFGASIQASGSGSFGWGSTATGGRIISSGTGSFAFGYAKDFDITASGIGAFAGGYLGSGIGASVTASGNGSFAFGEGVLATNYLSTAFGKGFTNSTASSFMVGYSSTPTFTVTATGVGIGTTSPYTALSVVGQVVASYFTATSTTASTFPYASTTALTVSGTNGLFLGSLNGPLQANNGVVSATTSIGVLYGGTGLTSAPSYGQIMVGNSSSGYTLTATSSLGLLGSSNIGTASVIGQFPYYASASNTLTATSGIFINTAGNFGVGTTSPSLLSKFAVGGNSFFGGTIITTGAITSGAGVSLTGDININASVDRKILALGNGVSSGNLTIQGADSFSSSGGGIKILAGSDGDSSAAGGSVFISGGTGSTNGNVILGSNGTSFIGNVGIGTTSPYAKLSVVGQVVASYFTATSTTASTFPYASTTALTVSGTGYFGGGTGIWNSSGYVGIGTTTPLNILSVERSINDTSTTGVSRSNAILNLYNPVTAAIGQGSMISFDTNYNSGSQTRTSRAFIKGGSEFASFNAGGFLSFGTNLTAPSDSMSEAMRIDSSQRLGIGTIAPTEKLTVNGNILSNGTTTTATLDFGQYKQRRVVIEGDSISDNASNIDWTWYLASSSPYFKSATTTNYAVAGNNTTDMVSQYATEAHLSRPTLPGDDYWFFLYAGINDISSIGNTPDQIYSRLKSLWNSARSDGYKVVAMTLFYSNAFATSDDLRIDALNTLIRSDPSQYDYLVDMNSVLNPRTNSGDFADSTHTNATGAQKFAAAVARTIDTNPFLLRSTSGIGVTPSSWDMSSIGGITIGTTTASSSQSMLGVQATSSRTYALNVFNTSGSSIFSVLTSGKIGVGSTTPWGLFSVNANALASGAPQFVVGSSTATNLIVANSGYVGIGTASPSATLHIQGDSGLRLQESSNIRYFYVTPPVGGADTVFGNSGTSAGFRFANTSIGTFFTMIGSSGNIGVATTSPWALLSINPNGISGPSFAIGSSTQTSFIVTNAGSVGIGTSTPISLLSLVDSTSATGGINFGSDVNLYRSAANVLKTDDDISVGSTYIQNNGTIYASNGLVNLSTLNNARIRASDSGAIIQRNIADTNSALLVYQQHSGSTGHILELANSSATTTVFTQSGRLGVGSTTPWAMLSINPNGISGPSFAIGSSTATSFLVSNSGSVMIGTTTSLSTDKLSVNGGNLFIRNLTPQFVLIDTQITDSSFGMRAQNGIASFFRANDNSSLSAFLIAFDLANARTGIGTTAPASKLHVIATTEQLRLGYDTSNYSKFTVSSAGALTIAPSTNATSAFNFTNVAGTSVLNIDTTNGRIGVASSTPWRTLSVVGTVAFNGLTSSATGNAVCITTTKDITDAGGGTCTPSSIRFKENVETLASSTALDILSQLRVVSFDYKAGSYSPEESPASLGLIAEEVELVDPRLVDYGYDGQPLTLHFERITGITVQAIQELNQRLQAIENQSSSASAIVSVESALQAVMQRFSDMGVQISQGLAKFKKVIVESLTVGSREKPSGITLYDEVTGDPYCLKISNGKTKTEAGECGSVATTQTENNSQTTTGGVVGESENTQGDTQQTENAGENNGDESGNDSDISGADGVVSDSPSARGEKTSGGESGAGSSDAGGGGESSGGSQ